MPLTLMQIVNVKKRFLKEMSIVKNTWCLFLAFNNGNYVFKKNN